MSPQRRRSDSGLGWLIENWVLVVAVVGAILAFAHLEDHVTNIQNRADFHWGHEW